MKRILSSAFVGVALLLAFNLMATTPDTTLKESVFKALGIKGEISSIESDYNALLPTDDETSKVDPENLGSIFEVYSVATTLQTDDPDRFNTGKANLDYTKKLASMEKLVRDSNKSIKAAEKIFDKEYSTADADVDEVLKQYLAYKKAVNSLLDAENKESRNKLLKDGSVTADGLKSKKEAAQKLVAETISTFTNSLVTSSAIGKKDVLLAAIKKLDKDTSVTVTEFKDSDVIPAKNCDKKDAADCEAQGKVFLKNIIDKGEQPAYGTIYVKDKKSCAMDKVMKTLGSVFNLGQVLCDTQVRKHGMVKADGSPNTGSLACLSAYKHLGNTKDNALLNPYISKLDNANAMNLAMLTQGSGAPASIGMGGSTPTNVLSAGAGTNSAGSGNGADAVKSSVSSAPDGGVTRFNAAQAVSSFYNPATSTYKDMAASASSLMGSIKPVNTTISKYNEALTYAMVSSNPKVAALPAVEKNWATSTLQATTSTTQLQQVDALRLEFSKQQAQIQAVVTEMDVTQRKLGLAQFMSLYGSQTQSEIALQEVATYSVSLKMLQSQGKYAQTRLALLMGSLGMGQYRYGFMYNNPGSAKDIFSIDYMYASNENRNMPKAIKLENIKTPITLKKGWQNDFKKYIEEMSEKSAEAKRAMNEAKTKIKDLLAQKLPFISLEKLPQQGEIRDELINMQSIKQASLKNLGVINNAMACHNSRKNAYTADQYATFKKEEETVNGAMRRTISSINGAEKPVSEVYNVVGSLHQVVPRAEALRAVAKQMVDQGL